MNLQSQVYKIKMFIVRVETLRILYFYYLRKLKIEMNITVTSLLYITDLVFVGSVYRNTNGLNSAKTSIDI